MKASSAFPSTYLKAADLDGKNLLLKMQRVDMEKVGEDMKPILFFLGLEKGLVLNRTNSAKIVQSYGDEMDDWAGQEIVLFSAMVDFKGDTVEAIRVRAPQPKDRPRRDLDRRQGSNPKPDPISTGGHGDFPGDRPVAPADLDDEIPDFAR